MKTFLQLTKEECREIYPEVEINAQTLYASANILARHENYGNAIGLLILGSEEYIKCFLLFLEGYGFDLLKTKEIQGIFSKHRSRHAILRDFYSIWMVLKHVLDAHSFTSGKGFATQLLHSAIQLIPARNNYHWWEKADYLKQKGFYADYLNRLISPSNLTKSDYENALAKTKDIPTDIQYFMNKIKAMNKKELDDFLPLFEESQLPILIGKSIKRKTSRQHTT
ncbi:MAG: AbiV family abortive infection protein [Chitinophagaceae bacterium]|nr:AbiV family abortive infection protein [Chitinophagaceae bacterium]